MPRAKEAHDAVFTRFVVDQRLIAFLLITRLLAMQKCANFELLRVNFIINDWCLKDKMLYSVKQKMMHRE